MTHPACLALLFIVPFSLALSGPALGSQHDAHERMLNEHAAAAKEPALKTQEDLAREVKALRARVAALEALKPGFTNFMPDFAERFHVMHRAGDAGDWAVAAHELAEMQRLARVSRHIDPKLGALMRAFMDGNLRKLTEAIEHGNARSFQAALKDAVAACNGCHAAAGSTLVVSLNVDKSLNMRHPHAFRSSTVPGRHGH